MLPQESIKMEINVPVEMRDGTKLRADVYRPDDKDKHPAVLIRTPYNKAITGNNDLLNIIDTAHAGYAVIIQDVRGRFASEGEWTRESMLTIEGYDGYDSVEWVGSQPWCDGSVGMAGASYMAGLQWIAAMENPPSLKAIAPWMGGMGTMNRGMQPPPESGAISLSTAVAAIPQTCIELADRFEREGRDVTDMRRTINRALDNPEEFYNFLPLKDLPLARFDRIREMWNARLRASVPKADQELHQRYDKIIVPCLHVCGWYDILEHTSFESFKNLKERGGSPLAREGQHIIVGPWPHGRLTNYLGDLNFGYSAGGLFAQISAQNIAFFDKYLRGKEISIPPVRYFLMGKNRWRNSDSWPLPQTLWQRFYLHSNGSANTAEGDGLLNRDQPGSEPADMFLYNPHLPVPSIGGRIIGVGLVPGPLDQTHIEKRGDVLCYTTTELVEDVEITGPLEIHIFAATSARDTDFTAKVIDVYPDGRA
ncbi:CocE/NonD family hydrolase, partial [Thermodesulfobacteriota bacterium]